MTQHELEIILGVDCLMGVEMGLKLDMNEAQSMINEDATTRNISLSLVLPRNVNSLPFVLHMK